MGKQETAESDHAYKARFPADAWERLEASATRNMRSINQELVWLVMTHCPEAPPADSAKGRRPK
jgi:hypothetical protein